MTWCEAHDVDFVLGLAKNERLVEMVNYHLGMAQCAYAATMQSERVYGELEYRTLDTWSRSRRVVTRAEHSHHGDNPRFVVTSLSIDEIDAGRFGKKEEG